MRYSPNPKVQATIEALLALGCPPIPVAPKQNPRDEWCHRVVKENKEGLFCPIDKHLNPIPKFTGKNPSYLDHNGLPRICKHGEFQNRLPTDAELRRFFCHPDTGVGSLGGHAGVNWLDFDAKCYPSQEACDADVERIISNNNLQNTWIERTGSGGWRIAVRPQQKPTFTNFTTSPDGQHVGEALFQGRFTVLAPSIHPNGNPYRRTGMGTPIEVESLESIGICPSKDEQEQAERNQKREQRKATNPHYGEPTNPQDDPWDIRNFAHYFEGYHERGDGWAAAKCPHHNGTSQTSFRVRLDTGEYKLWCGCGTKDVYKSGLALAVAAGYELPQTPGNQTSPINGIQFKVTRRSLDEFLPTFPELESEAGQDWLKMQKFTPDHTVDSQFFDWESQPGENLAVNSGLGTGKTYYVHSKFLADDNVGANAFGYRNSLLIQFSERGKNWYHLQQDLKKSKDDLLLVADPNSRISACVDSLIYFQPHHFENKRLVLDEIEGTFEHLYTSKTAVSFHRQLCKDRMGEAIANSEATILLDGNLTDLSVAHAERISGRKFAKIKNLYQGNRGKVTFYTGTLKLGKDEETGETVVKERRINDYSLLHKMMMEDSEPFICGSDSQEKLEAWHSILQSKGRTVFRLDGTNSNTPEAKKFLSNPAAYVYTNKIDAVLFSPTAESGLSIDTETKIKLKEWFIDTETEIRTESGEVLQISIKDYFKRGYFFFLGVVSTNKQTQFLGRLRDSNTHNHVFCQNQGIDSGKIELTSEHIQEAFVDYTLACSQISLSDVSEADKQRLIADQAAKLVERSNDAHFQYECHLKAREVFERNHLRKCLEYALHEAGYQVEVVTGYRASRTELEAAQEAVQVRKSKEIFAAQRLTDEEASDKARKFDATQQDKSEVTRHRLVSRLPGIENKTTTTSRVVALPQSAVAEIESGRVSLETAKKLGFPTPETPTTQAVDLGHLPLSFSITQREGVPAAERGEVEVVITETKPIFDPEFIRKVKYQDRAWLSKVELHFLLQHPEITKLLQQKRWYKKLQVFSDPNEPDCVKRLNLSTYKSDWLKVHTLLEMGIEFFLNPESQWTQDTPEAVEFWEKGKDARRSRYIGTNVGDSNPCEYIGRVLDKLDVKRKCDRIRNEAGEKIRVYRVDTDYLSSPMRSTVFECVEQRIESTLEPNVILNWDVIVENQWTPQNQEGTKAETPTTQAVDRGHLPLNSLNNQGEGVPGSEDANFCLESLSQLESEAIHSESELVALFGEIERRGQHCEGLLPQEFWQRASRALGNLTDALEAKESYLESATRLLREAVAHGADTVRSILGRWTPRERWEAISRLEANSDEDMQRLVQVAPNWAEWSFAGEAT